MSFVLGARRMILDPNAHDAFAHGGTLWFNDLTAPDPYMALPVVAVALTYVERGRRTGS